MKTETAMKKKNAITANVPNDATLKEIWDRVVTRRPSGCYHIRMVSASDDRALEIMPSYEGWSSVLSENQIIPGMVGSGFVEGYILSEEQITDFPVGKVEFLLAEGEEELILDEEQYNPPYNSLEAREYLRDRSKEARRAKLVCREIGWLYATMRAVWFYHEIEDKLNLLMEGMATYDDFAHHPHDCLSVTAIKDAGIALIKFLDGLIGSTEVGETCCKARDILRARVED